LGRVSSFDWFISIGLVPLSFAITGPVAAVFGARTTLVGAGILGGIVTFGFLFLPGMRDVERSGALARASAEDDELPLGFLADDPMLPIGAGETPRRGPEAAEIGS
jgi:hypothetical protein